MFTRLFSAFQKFFETELVSEYTWKLTEYRGTVKLSCSRSDNFDIVSDEGKIPLSDGDTFKREYLESINAVVREFSSAEYSFGEPRETAQIVVKVTHDQFNELTSITVGHREIPLNGDHIDTVDGEIHVDVTEHHNEYCISLQGFVPYTNPTINFMFDSGYPEISCHQINRTSRCQYADLTKINRRTYTVSVPDQLDLSGSVYLSLSDPRIDTISDVVGTHTPKDSISFHLFEKGVKAWNSDDFTIRIEPDKFGPITKIKAISTKTTFNFTESDFERLSSVIVRYPEWAVKVDGSIRYESELVHNSKYHNKRQLNDTTIKFTNVIPNTNFDISHDVPMFMFENNSISYISISEGTECSICASVIVDSYTYVRVELSDSLDDCTVKFGNEDVDCISEPTVKCVPLSHGSSIIKVHNSRGECIFEKELTRHQLAPIIKIVVAESDVSVYKSQEPVRYVADYTHR